MEEQTEHQNYKYVLENVLKEVYQYIRVPAEENNIIRIHTKKLEFLGEISFPLNIKNWYHLIDRTKLATTILEYSRPENSQLEEGESDIRKLEKNSEQWCVKLKKTKIDKDNVHLYLDRVCTFKWTLGQCFNMKESYGALYRPFRISVNVIIDDSSKKNIENSLSLLRLTVLQRVIKNLSEFQINDEICDKLICINLSNTHNNGNEVLCGIVVDANGSKDTTTSADDFYSKRSTDMRLMAEHKYGLRIKSSESWTEYFKKLGEAAVTIELLQNKPHKNLKITLNDLSSTNKGASFIFYNCARLSALFREFDKKVNEKIYPELVSLDNIDFSLLNQPEEWELLYVYIMQYPLLIKSCIKDVEKGIVNPHYLISFLSNLCSVFSVYYRRIRVLVQPRAHLIPIIHARIYLLKALEQVFHRMLKLLDIDPIKEM